MKAKRKDIIYVGIVIVLLFLLKCSHDSKKVTQADLILKNNNIKAMRDTINTFITKTGYLVSEKISIVTELKDLKNYNDSLYQRVNGLSRELGSRPIIYVNIGAKIIHDTIEVERQITRIDSNEYLINFSKDTIYSPGNEKHIAGKIYIILDSNNIQVGEFTIDKDEILVNAEIVFSEKNDNIIASVISNHPGFNAESITPVTLDPKLHPTLKKLNNKRFVAGPYIGIGIGQNFTIAPQIGIGLSYKIIAF